VSSTPSDVRKIAAAIPGAVYEEMPGAPHMLFIEQPDETAKRLISFLTSL
jgi:3-oxoadipate enol-lactonase